jgi:hypothetical protein
MVPFVGAVVASIAAPAAMAQFAFQRVYMTGDPVPSIGPGVTATFYGRGPVINSGGSVCFEGGFAGPGINSSNSRALFVGAPGSFTPYLRQGSQLAGGAAGVLTDSCWRNPNFSDSGTVAVVELLSGNVNNSSNQAIVFGAPPTSVAQTGPVTGSNIAALSPPVMNAAGQYAYLTDFVEGGPTRGLWFGSVGQAPAPIALIGDQAPGYAAGAHIQFLTTPTISDTGRVAFLSDIALTQSSSRVTLYTGAPGALQIAAGVNDAVPGVAGSTFYEFDESPSLNRAGDLAYSGWYRVGGVNWGGVFAATAASPTTATPVFLSSSQTLPLAPAGSAPSSIWDVSIGSTRAVAFRVTLTGPGITTSNDEGFWINRGGTLACIAREGQQVPGLAAGVLQGSVSHQSAVNAHDQVAFMLSTSDSGNSLCVWDPTLGLEVVAHTGMLFSVGPGDTRTISAIDFAGSRQLPSSDSTFNPAGTGGLASGFNDAGLLVAGLEFTNGSYGIFETSIPAPSSILAMGLFAGCCSRRSRKRPGRLS